MTWASLPDLSVPDLGKAATRELVGPDSWTWASLPDLSFPDLSFVDQIPDLGESATLELAGLGQGCQT